jgi:hypothetical protein
MSDSYLYFYSTVAQVSAAIIGFGGIFLVFYFPIIQKLTFKYSEWLSKMLELYFKTADYKVLKGGIILKDISQIERTLTRIENEFKKGGFDKLENINYDRITAYINIIKIHIQKRKDIKSNFYFSFVFGSISIILSLSALVFNLNHILCLIFSFLTLICLIFSMIFSFIIIKNAIDDKIIN